MSPMGPGVVSFSPLRLARRVPVGRVVSHPATVLLADLSNFTGLTEALTAQAGADGAEAVGRELNAALAPLIESVLSHGGEVVKFSGDGLLCVFLAGDVAPDAARLAAGTAAGAVVRGPNGELHRWRAAIVSGEVEFVCLGGHRGRLELVAGGAAVARAHAIVGTSPPGGLVEDADTGAAVAPLREPAPAELADPSDFVPRYVRGRLEDSGDHWLREMATLTMMFAAIEPGAAEGALQRQALALQATADAHGGELLRFGFDGDRLVCEIAFGLSVGSAATGALEAVQCALAMRRRLVGVHVGVATGRLLLGPIGSSRRRQLTTLGSAVNLAARLMQRADADVALVDDVTWAATQGRFEGRREVAGFKGVGQRVCWQVDGVATSPEAPDRPMFGRDAEMHALRWAMASDDALRRHALIEGEAGMGKTRLARELAAELRGAGTPVWTAAATPVGRDEPYAALHALLRHLCNVDDAAGDASQRLRAVAQHVAGDADRAPLLADALGVAMADTPATRALSGPMRAQSIRALLTVLVDRAAGRCSVLLVEDVHWLDSASWAWLQQVSDDVPRVRMVLTTRPVPSRLTPSEQRRLVDRAAACIQMQPLPARDVDALAAHRIGLERLPEALSQWLMARAQGNPFFVEELLRTLSADREIEARDGKLVRAPNAAALVTRPPVPSIESAVQQRIWRLEYTEAIVLKAASVIGPSFDTATLEELTAAEVPRGVDAVLERLIAAEMTAVTGPGTFVFRHLCTHEAAYKTLTPDQRSQLHGEVAASYERRLGTRADERASELAHHWTEARHRTKALQWLDRAGQRALRTGADQEAATQFRRALRLAGTAEPPGKMAAWHRQLARAQFGLGEIEGVAAEASRALELLVGPLPATPARWWACAAASLLRRISRLPMPARTSELHDLSEGARAAGLLAESAYFLNAPEKMIACAFLAVGLAERTPHAAPVSAAYGMLAMVAGMARAPRIAERWLARARERAAEADDPYELGVAWFYTGLVHASAGSWGASLEAAQRALALTEPLNADMQSGFQLTLLATNALYTSDYVSTRTWMDTVRGRAVRASNVQQQGWACNVVSVADLHQGRHDLALSGAARGRAIFEAERDLVSLIIAEGVCCAALTRSGRLTEALEATRRATAHIQNARPTTWGQLEGFAGPCEAWAAALAAGMVDCAQARVGAAPLLAKLRMFAALFPFGRARRAWIEAAFDLAAGRWRNARRRLRQAVELGRRHLMPFEELQATRMLQPLLTPGERDAGRAALLKLEARVMSDAP